MDFANSMDRTLNMKIKIPYTKSIETYHKVIYDNHLYDIIYTDSSKNKVDLYLYLEEVRELE